MLVIMHPIPGYFMYLLLHYNFSLHVLSSNAIIEEELSQSFSSRESMEVALCCALLAFAPVLLRHFIS